MLAIADEIYEHIVFDGHEHVAIASLPGMAERTVTISGLSKTYSVTGWRIGWAIAPAALTPGIRKMHDFLTVAAPSPLQEAGAVGASPAGSLLPRHGGAVSAPARLAGATILQQRGFVCYRPAGAYYVMTDISAFGFENDVAFARYLVQDVGVATIPGSSFYSQPGRRRVARSLLFLEDRRDNSRSRAPALRAYRRTACDNRIAQCR